MKRILLVDDDPVIVHIYREKLERAGFQVETASDGLVAMKMLHTVKPDVMVLDMMMPKFSGLEILKYVRSQATLNNVRVVILSNMHFGGEQREAASDEADKALPKSDCTPELLVEAINEVLTGASRKTPEDRLRDVQRRLDS